MQKARGHNTKSLPLLVSMRFPWSGFFSPFPYGTGSLSVTHVYLALEDGAPSFIQSFSGFVLLRILLVVSFPSRTRLSLPTVWLSNQLPFKNNTNISQSYNPHRAETLSVWASPRSLATTWGISIDFYSYRYLDVSVPCVRSNYC
jgi:hypothetical protein